MYFVNIKLIFLPFQYVQDWLCLQKLLIFGHSALQTTQNLTILCFYDAELKLKEFLT